MTNNSPTLSHLRIPKRYHNDTRDPVLVLTARPDAHKLSLRSPTPIFLLTNPKNYDFTKTCYNQVGLLCARRSLFHTTSTASHHATTDVIGPSINTTRWILCNHLSATQREGLPNEIILAIFELLEPDDLLSAFAVSNWFNRLALVSFKAYYHISEDSHVSLHPQSLRGFNAALTIPHVQRLSFRFTTTSHLIRDINNLARFCRRLETIEEVLVDFNQDLLSDALSDHEREGFSRAVQALTLALTGKMGPAVRVTQSGVHILDPADIFQPEINRFSSVLPPRSMQEKSEDREVRCLFIVLLMVVLFLQPTSLLSRMSCLFAGVSILGSQYAMHQARRNPSVTTLSAYDKVVKVPSLDSLRTLHVSKPPGKEQSLVVCNLDAIHTLRISQLMNGADDSWKNMLACIHSPAISGLSVSQSNLTVSDTLSFLSRHSGITEMLYTPTAIPHPPPRIPFDLLPNLKFLRASPEFIGFIHETPGALPNLEKIEFHIYLRTEPFIEPLKWALRKMVSRKTDIHIEIVIPEDTRHSHWLAEGDEKGGVDYALPCVKTLSLYWFDKKGVGIMPRWLLRFPELRRVKLADVNLRREQRVDLVRALRQSCPKLETVSIGSTEKAVEDWLSMSGIRNVV